MMEARLASYGQKGSKRGLFGDVFPILGTFYLTYKYNGEIYGAFGAVD